MFKEIDFQGRELVSSSCKMSFCRDFHTALVQQNNMQYVL